MAKIQSEKRNYTIRETAKISGLPESTLRYYETIGIIRPIARDKDTKRRVYTEKDVDWIVAIACLNATGMSIEDMKNYLGNFKDGEEGAFAQIEILNNRLKHLEEENRYAELRIKYVSKKIDFWKATVKKDTRTAKLLTKEIYAVADEMKLPQAPGSHIQERKIQ